MTRTAVKRKPAFPLLPLLLTWILLVPGCASPSGHDAEETSGFPGNSSTDGAAPRTAAPPPAFGRFPEVAPLVTARVSSVVLAHLAHTTASLEAYERADAAEEHLFTYTGGLMEAETARELVSEGLPTEALRPAVHARWQASFVASVAQATSPQELAQVARDQRVGERLEQVAADIEGLRGKVNETGLVLLRLAEREYARAWSVAGYYATAEAGFEARPDSSGAAEACLRWAVDTAGELDLVSALLAEARRFPGDLPRPVEVSLLVGRARAASEALPVNETLEGSFLTAYHRAKYLYPKYLTFLEEKGWTEGAADMAFSILVWAEVQARAERGATATPQEADQGVAQALGNQTLLTLPDAAAAWHARTEGYRDPGWWTVAAETGRLAKERADLFRALAGPA